NIVDREGDHLARELLDRFHYAYSRSPTSSRGSVITPLMAVAAAVSGLARKVRPPLPCRPSKLRLLVLTAYCPGASWSPFMAMHIEHPASRHSAPASLKTRSSPSASACAFTCCEPGTTISRTLSATLRPLISFAASRKSVMRELVQLPINTTSTGLPRSR